MMYFLKIAVYFALSIIGVQLKGFYIFVIMESIVIHPESAEQLKTVKAVLKALKVQFESNPTILPAHVSESIHKGIKQYEAGESISLEEFTRKHLSE